MLSGSVAIKVPALLGPTASGKSSLAMQLAASAGCEIVSCDSRQVYRFMDIGTAKPLPEERRQVRHWLIDIIDPSQHFSASAFVADAVAVIRECATRGVIPLLVGGTGLYFESLRGGIGPQVASDPGIREALVRRAGQEGSAALHGELQELDPEAAASIHPNDLRRIVRALAVFRQTGQRFSHLKRQSSPPPAMKFTVAVILPPREELYEKINRRVDTMMQQGLWEEFRSLRKRGYDAGSPGLRCLGYQELFAVEKGERPLDAAVASIKQNTRRYAKRQISWFRAHNGDAIVENCSDQQLLAQRVAAALAL